MPVGPFLMEFHQADSRTGLPFKLARTSKKIQATQQASLLNRFFQRLGWKQKPGETAPNPMKEITLLVSCVAGGKARKKGDCVAVTDLKAAELISMKVAVLKRELPNAKLQPWERPALKPEAKPVGVVK